MSDRQYDELAIVNLRLGQISVMRDVHDGRATIAQVTLTCREHDGRARKQQPNCHNQVTHALQIMQGPPPPPPPTAASALCSD